MNFVINKLIFRNNAYKLVINFWKIGILKFKHYQNFKLEK